MTPAFEPSRRALLLFCALAAIAVYVNSLANGFALDDVFIIETNQRVHDLLDQRAIWLTPYWPFQGPELGLYRPATIFLFALQWAAGDGAPWVFHAASVALHAVVTVFVFMLLERLAGYRAAFAGALVFAVHPVHTEAIANVVGQAEIVGALVVLGACLVHSGRPAGNAVSWPRRLALVLLFAVALLTKESTVVLPALLVAVDFAQRRVHASVRGFAVYADAMLMPLLLLAATLAAYLLLRFDVMGGAVIGVDAAPAMPYLREEHRVLNALRALPELLRLLVLPFDLSADYLPGVLLPVEEIRPMVVLGAVLLAALALLALLTPWRPQTGFPAAWFLIAIVTVSNLFFPIGVLVAERTLYLPSVALSALVAFTWEAAAAHGRPRLRALAAGLALVIVGFGVRTWVRNPDWKDTIVVMNALVRDQPHSYRAQWSLAASYRAQGDIPRALHHYRIAEAIYDRDAAFLAEYAEFLLTISRFDEAVVLLERSHDARPGIHHTVLLLAYAYLASERYADARAVIRGGEQIGIPRSTASFIRAAAFEGLGSHDAAAAAWRVGIRHSERPSWRMWSYLARALAAAGRVDDARVALATARGLTADTAAASTIDQVERGLASGCYAVRSADAASRGVASCDNLGRWIGFVAPSAGSSPAGDNDAS